MTKQDREEFKAYCMGVNPAQLHNVYQKEKRARRGDYAAIAWEALESRGLV